MEGALPLGMMDDAEFSVMQFTLTAGDRLVLVSDGVAEATDADRQLFGFDRVHELLQTGKSASEVASVAQRFGQEDDISVIKQFAKYVSGQHEKSLARGKMQPSLFEVSAMLALRPDA
jgi:serine/threonine protein phosphatase PrpC